MYKLCKDSFTSTVFCIQRTEDNAFIPFVNGNNDYKKFKAEINADEAQLEDADGNLMTPEQAKEYVKELP